MNAAIYCRVSTNKQELDNQLHALKTFARKRGFKVKHVFTDVASGKRADRTEFNRMMSAAAQRKFEVILVWSLDRLSREGMSKTVNLIEHLNKIGVNVVSYTEPYLDTTNELARNILLAVVSTLAKAEREKISDRTKAGLERLKRQGKKLGRPPGPGEDPRPGGTIAGQWEGRQRDCTNGKSESCVCVVDTPRGCL